jgi:hypothetical protein
MRTFGNKQRSVAVGHPQRTIHSGIRKVWIGDDPLTFAVISPNTTDSLVHWYVHDRGGSFMSECLGEDAECPACLFAKPPKRLHTMLLFAPVFGGQAFMQIDDDESDGSVQQVLDDLISNMDIKKDFLRVGKVKDSKFVEGKILAGNINQSIQITIDSILKSFEANNANLWSDKLGTFLNSTIPKKSVQELALDVSWVKENFPPELSELEAQQAEFARTSKLLAEMKEVELPTLRPDEDDCL